MNGSVAGSVKIRVVVRLSRICTSRSNTPVTRFTVVAICATVFGVPAVGGLPSKKRVYSPVTLIARR